MKQGIIIETNKGREEMFDNLMRSINTHYQVLPVYRNDFELGAIAHAVYNTDLDEFLFLHDTCEIKNNSLFELVFETHKGKSVALADHPCIFGMYLGKYKREVLNKILLPKAHTKLEAVEYEIEFNNLYCKTDGDVQIISNPLHNNDIFCEMFGRKNMKLENDYLIKYKATWSRSML